MLTRSATLPLAAHVPPDRLARILPARLLGIFPMTGTKKKFLPFDVRVAHPIYMTADALNHHQALLGLISIDDAFLPTPLKPTKVGW